MPLLPPRTTSACLAACLILSACSSRSTSAPAEITAAIVTARYPAPGTLFATPTTKVEVRLATAIEPSRITSEIFFVEGPNGTVEATVTYDDKTQTATLTPNTPWSLDVKWTVHFGAASAPGQPSVASTWQFETRMGRWSDQVQLHTSSNMRPQHTQLGVDSQGQAIAVASYRSPSSLDQTLVESTYSESWQTAKVMATHGAFKDLQLAVTPSGHASLLGSRDDQLIWVQRPGGQDHWSEQILPGSFLPPEFGVQIGTDTRGHSVAMWSAKGLSAVVSATHDGLEWSDDKVLTTVARSALLATSPEGHALMASGNKRGLLTRRLSLTGEWLPKHEHAFATEGLLDVDMSDAGGAWVAVINKDSNDIQTLLVRHSHPIDGWLAPIEILRLRKNEFILQGAISVGPRGDAAVIWQTSQGPGLGIDVFASVYDQSSGEWSTAHKLGTNLPSNRLIRTNIEVDIFGNITTLYWVGNTAPRTHTARYIPSIGWRSTKSFDGFHIALISDRRGRTHVVGWSPGKTGMTLFARSFK